MPRKQQFSAKQKKQQLQEKRKRKQNQPYRFGQDEPEQQQEGEAASWAEEYEQRMNMQPVGLLNLCRCVL